MSTLPLRPAHQEPHGLLFVQVNPYMELPEGGIAGTTQKHCHHHMHHNQMGDSAVLKVYSTRASRCGKSQSSSSRDYRLPILIEKDSYKKPTSFIMLTLAMLLEKQQRMNNNIPSSGQPDLVSPHTLRKTISMPVHCQYVRSCHRHPRDGLLEASPFWPGPILSPACPSGGSLRPW